MDVLSEAGDILEYWEGLCLKVLSPMNEQQAWVAPLLGPYLERRIQALMPGSDMAVAVDQDGTVDRRVRRDRLLPQIRRNGHSDLLSPSAVIYQHRPHGKPELLGEKALSIAHADMLTLAVSSSGLVGCDVEPVVTRNTAVWQDLLGLERFTLAELVAHENAESIDVAATRIWSASECLKKAGLMPNVQLGLVQTLTDDAVYLSSGNQKIVTFSVTEKVFNSP